MLDPKVVKAMSMEIRKRSAAAKREYKTGIRALDQQIRNVVETLAEVGRSDALTAKLRDLEARRASLQAQSCAPSVIVTGAPEKCREIVSDLENFKDCTKSDEVHAARGLIRQIIGEVVIKEESDGTFAYPIISNQSVYIVGAQDAATWLQPIFYDNEAA